MAQRNRTTEAKMTQTRPSAAPLGQLASTPIRRIALVAAGVGLIALAAKIQVPFWPVPMTLQTLALMLVIGASGFRLSLEIVLAYLAVGLAGLPVFAGPAAGPLYFTGPTAGFLIGFVAAAAIVGWAADRGLTKRPVMLFGAMFAGELAIFGLGFLWLGFIFTTSSGNTLGADIAFASGVKPFILGDMVKIAVAAAVISGLRRRFSRD